MQGPSREQKSSLFDNGYNSMCAREADKPVYGGINIGDTYTGVKLKCESNVDLFNEIRTI